MDYEKEIASIEKRKRKLNREFNKYAADEDGHYGIAAARLASTLNDTIRLQLELEDRLAAQQKRKSGLGRRGARTKPVGLDGV